MLDADIRAALHRRVKDGDATAGVIDELGIRLGEVRVDVAVVNGTLTGYEIKSPADSLRRLPRQVEGYSAVLDAAGIVLAEQHVAGALALVPGWWRVLVATEAEDGVRLDVLREGEPNPSIDPLALAESLWHADTIAMLDARGAARGVRGKPRIVAWRRLVEVCTLDEIRAGVRALLKTRAVG
jgi:hypothetical protein